MAVAVSENDDDDVDRPLRPPLVTVAAVRLLLSLIFLDEDAMIAYLS